MHEDFTQSINESDKLLDLEEDWDDMGSSKVNPQLLIFAQKFLFEIIKFTQKDIVIPEINSLLDGGIDICFRNPNKFRLLICFGLKKISWYGDNGKSEDVIKNSSSYEFFISSPIYFDLLNYIQTNFEKVTNNDSNFTRSI